ncbi:alpha/beta hydrolase [Methylobacterium sp. NEAU 140]|uniref:alpha/beta hydrolase n=1 Tax=Methylobacterium sp. NEAU 140 TaxID=3064945 RepID=UPI0027338AF3|nr:alpha/beta hydrolase [Methylobacterium sp. NEAU 140]MDP4026951.1 alpha/beta hydrolase [Methylobacterium sp. NEAU 140]
MFEQVGRATVASIGVAAFIALSACAGRPTGVLLPVALANDVPGTSRVDMLVATTRKAAAKPGVLFSGERGDAVTYTDLAVSIPPDATRQPGSVQWPKSLPGNPATDFVALRADPLDRGKVAAWTGRAVRRGAKRHVLVFVHGFNNKFEDAVFRFAQIVHDSGAEVAPVLFTWPSRGSVLAYGYDRESTNFSRNGLETLLRDLAKDPNVGEVTVLAHSMGNWLTLESLRQMTIRDRRVAPKIRNVILAAPDVDMDLAREAFRDIGKDRPRLTLMVSGDDQALAVSRLIWGDSVRLGAIDPTAEPYRSELERENISVLNLSSVKGDDPLNHGKFASGDVVALLGKRLADGQPISDGQVGFGDRLVSTAAGAASTMATGAALAVAAPVAIIDPQTRETYGEHLSNVGSGFRDTIGSTVDLAGAPVRAVVSAGR